MINPKLRVHSSVPAAGDCCVFKIPRRSVGGKQTESSVFQFFGVVWTRPNASKMYNLNNAERLMLYTDWILALNVDYFQVRSVNASVVIFFILSRHLDVLAFSLF